MQLSDHANLSIDQHGLGMAYPLPWQGRASSMCVVDSCWSFKVAVWPGCVIDADARQAMAVVFIVQTVQDDQGQTLNAAQIRFQRPMQQALNHSQRHCHQ